MCTEGHSLEILGSRKKGRGRREGERMRERVTTKWHTIPPFLIKTDRNRDRTFATPTTRWG